jgi:hypothetical protein
VASQLRASRDDGAQAVGANDETRPQRGLMGSVADYHAVDASVLVA